MPLEEQKRWIIFVTSWNVQILSPHVTKIAKLMPLINELSVSIYISMPRTKTKSLKRLFWLAWEHTQMDFVGIFKIIQIY